MAVSESFERAKEESFAVSVPTTVVACAQIACIEMKRVIMVMLNLVMPSIFMQKYEKKAIGHLFSTIMCLNYMDKFVREASWCVELALKRLFGELCGLFENGILF